MRRGLTDLVNATPDLVVVGEAGTARDALRRISAVKPDVAILDARLPDGSRIDVCREIRSSRPETRCLILTSTGAGRARQNVTLLLLGRAQRP